MHQTSNICPCIGYQYRDVKMGALLLHSFVLAIQVTERMSKII
jgi:hypothetical protein